MGYDPTSNAVPMADPDHPVNPNLAFEQDLAAAVAANSGFLTQLCGLDGIFLDPRNCADPGKGNPYDPTTCNLADKQVADNSWGLRTYMQDPKGKRYIGISLGLWKNGAPTFETFKTRHLLALLDRTGEKGNNPGHWPKNSPPSHTVKPSQIATSSAIAVLAVLAHEYGHVLWFDTFVPSPGGNFLNNQNFCSGSFYPGGNWGGKPVDLPGIKKIRWAEFGDISPNAGADVQGLPNAIDASGYAGASPLLHNLHKSRNWASAFAAFSSNEDFVETFELGAVRDAKLQINGQAYQLTQLTADVIVANVVIPDVIFPPKPNSVLATKLNCFP